MEQNNSSRFVRECGDKKWSKERRLVVLVGLLVVLVIAPVTALPQLEMCRTYECIVTATRIIEGMDRNVAPCDDFYKFACFGWLSRHPMLPNEKAWDQFMIIQKKLQHNLRVLLKESDQVDDSSPLKLARKFYRMCMDTESAEELKLTPIFDIFSKLGLSRDLLLFDNSKNDSEIDLDLSRIEGVAERYLAASIFVKFSKLPAAVSKDRFVTKKSYLMISSPFPKHNLTDHKKLKSALIKKKHYIKEIVTLAGVTSENRASFADDIIEVFIKIAEMRIRPKQSSHVLFVTIKKLQTLTDASALRWNWTKYFEALFKNTDVILETDVHKVFVEDLEYLQKLPLLLSTTPRVTIARFVWWRVYITVAPEIIDLEQKLQSNMKRDGIPRWQRCVHRVDSHFKLVLANAYTQRYVHDQAREKALDMILELRAAFDEMLSESKWMDMEVRARLRKKLDTMKFSVGFPPWTTDHEELKKFYEGAEVIPGDKFQTFLRLTDVKQKRELKEFRGKLCEEHWQSFDENAGGGNTFTPATLLYCQGPFYNLHSIVTAWRIQLDENGKKFHGWNIETMRHYREKVECFIEQYSSYHSPELGENITVDGKRTVHENSVDNVAIRVAYRAYQKLKSRGLKEQALPGLFNYTQDQLFFLSFAQNWCAHYTNENLKDSLLHNEHVPNHFKVIGSLSNNEEFSKAWNCPIGSPTNPSHKCILW